MSAKMFLGTFWCLLVVAFVSTVRTWLQIA
jgi:hypothetical protein